MIVFNEYIKNYYLSDIHDTSCDGEDLGHSWGELHGLVGEGAGDDQGVGDCVHDPDQSEKSI